MRPVRLLVTGFGPFPGIPSNPSAGLAKHVAGSCRWGNLGVETLALVLPTTYAAITRDLMPAIEESRPDAILMIGVAGRSGAIRVEAFGRNRASTLLPDAARFTPTSLRLAEGPALRRTGMRPAVRPQCFGVRG